MRQYPVHFRWYAMDTRFTRIILPIYHPISLIYTQIYRFLTVILPILRLNMSSVVTPAVTQSKKRRCAITDAERRMIRGRAEEYPNAQQSQLQDWLKDETGRWIAQG